MIEALINSIITPEPHILGHRIKMSVSGVLERRGKILLVKEEDGYGLPAGHLEDYEWLAPKTGFTLEMFEEVGVSERSEPELYGLLIHPDKHKSSIGLVYKLKNFHLDRIITSSIMTAMREVDGGGFYSKAQVAGLLLSERLRKPIFNRPVLEAWLRGQGKFVKLV